MPADPSRPVRLLWTTAGWAAAVAELAAGDGPLGTRTVLVPRERVAHALRRELVRTGQTRALAGTQFADLANTARLILEAAGVDFAPGEGGRRSVRLRSVFNALPALKYFDVAQLKGAPGWDEAFAKTIGELEAAGATPDTLKKHPSPACRDVAEIWLRLERSAGSSWTTARILFEAAKLLEETPSRWPFDGPVLAAVTGDETVAAACFVRAIPRSRLLVLAALPTSAGFLVRLEALFGAEVADAVRGATPPAKATGELGLLSGHLFADPSLLTDPKRRVSAGPDGSVHLEEHAGVDAELEAAADWVAQQVLERGTPLEEIALVVPALHPLAGLISDRLGRLDWPGGPIPVFVAGGLPVAQTATGARLLTALRALQAHLSAASLTDLLPSLRTAGDRRHLSRGEAMQLLYALGTAGGHPANPAAALEWRERVPGREAELRAHLARLTASDEAGDEDGDPHERRNVERVLESLAAVGPALTALVEVARLLLAGERLDRQWPAMRDFFDAWLLKPGLGAVCLAQLDAVVQALADDPLCATVSGAAALDLVEGALTGLRVPTTRFGAPAVYVGTVRDAAGLPFRAVRFVGVSEGNLPSLAREDAVLSGALKAELLGPGFQSAGHRMESQLQGVYRVVANTSERVVLSAARTDLEGTSKEPSPVFIDAAVALRRPDSVTGAAGKAVPGLLALRRDSFEPARLEGARLRGAAPLSASAWLDRVARSGTGLPSLWSGAEALDLGRLFALGSEESGPMDGMLGAPGPAPALGGLTAETAISASRLKTLLECPKKFFFASVMGWSEPAGPPPQREVDPMSFGTLLHRTAEVFFRTHGAEFGQRGRSLAEWQAIGAEVADAQFDEFLQHYSLLGGPVREQQRDRLHRHFTGFLEYDWEGRGRTFVGVERGFGFASPLALAVGGTQLYVRGFIDRLDQEGSTTLVRDLKTGKAHPRSGKEAGADPLLDLQLALYGMVVRQKAAEWKVPTKVAAAYVFTGASEAERAFRADYAQLEASARGWLELALALLTERAFPRTPDPRNCGYCAFQPVCGGGAPARSERLLLEAEGAAGAFGKLRLEKAK